MQDLRHHRPRYHHPMTDASSSTSPSAFAAAAYAWLDSPAARNYVAGLLRRKRLYVNEADVLADVRSRIWVRMQKPHDNLDPARVAGYCKRIAENVLNDELRGFSDESFDDPRPPRKRGDSGMDDDANGDGADDADDGLAATSSGLGAVGSERDSGSLQLGGAEHELIEELRSLIETSGEVAWVVAGALSYLTLEYDRDCDRSDAPWPQAGSAPERALLWPALWFAGQRNNMFPTGGRHSAAQRQRLKRAGDRVFGLVALAKSTLTQGGPS